MVQPYSFSCQTQKQKKHNAPNAATTQTQTQPTPQTQTQNAKCMLHVIRVSLAANVSCCFCLYLVPCAMLFLFVSGFVPKRALSCSAPPVDTDSAWTQASVAFESQRRTWRPPLYIAVCLFPLHLYYHLQQHPPLFLLFSLLATSFPLASVPPAVLPSHVL